MLLGLGDNATHGLGTPSAHTYFQRLVINPPDEFADMRGICLSKVLPKLQQLNLAKSGTSSINCVDQQLPLLKPYSPDTFGIVVITIGNNDLIHDFGRTPPRDGALFGTKITNTSGLVKNFERRLEAIHARINTTFPGGYQIYIANIPDLVDGEDDIERTGLPPWPEWQYLLASYNRTISLFAKHNPHVTWVDIRTGFLGHGIHCTHFWHPRYHEDDPHSWFLNDIEGPNHRGHDAIRRRFLLEMANELPDRLP
ncbi:MAG: SGNH/GDSL hydrolase family protein [Planctomycetaceae bacterium]